MSIKTQPSTWKAVEIAIRSKRSSAHSSTASGSSPSNSTDSSPASSSSNSSVLIPPPRVRVPRRARARRKAQLLVALPARVGREGLVLLLAAVEPALDEPCDRRVELLARHAPEQRLADLRIRRRARRARRCRRPARACRRRRAPSCPESRGRRSSAARRRAGSRPAAAERADGVAEARLQVLDQPAEALLGLGHREVAVRLAGAADRAASDVVDLEREADPRRARRRRRRPARRARWRR